MKNQGLHFYLILLVFVSIPTFMLAMPGYALDIELEPATVQRSVDGKARIRIYATSAVDLISMGIKLSFDPSIVQVENAAKYEDFDNGWIMDADGNPGTTDDQYYLPLVTFDNTAGTVTMMGGRLIGETTTGLNGRVLLGVVDFVAVGNGSSDLDVDRFAYHVNHPTKTFDNFVRLDGSVDEPANLPGTIGVVYVGEDACECDLNNDGSCNILDWPNFIEDWGSSDCNDPNLYCECDINGDGSCNILDWPYFIEDWGMTGCPVL
jgi:hypothetical protein